jgi:MerR family mercuric resistance operon transcriptional regulator
MAMTIAALGRAAGVGVETVRYYQRRGLLPVPAAGGSIRRYD